jgi:hypothetical protein
MVVLAVIVLIVCLGVSIGAFIYAREAVNLADAEGPRIDAVRGVLHVRVDRVSDMFDEHDKAIKKLSIRIGEIVDSVDKAGEIDTLKDGLSQLDEVSAAIRNAMIEFAQHKTLVESLTNRVDTSERQLAGAVHPVAELARLNDKIIALTNRVNNELRLSAQVGDLLHVVGELAKASGYAVALDKQGKLEIVKVTPVKKPAAKKPAKKAVSK